MRTRPTLSAPQLFAILRRQFNEKRPKECVACQVPLPFVVSRADDVSANWQIGTAVSCPHKCDRLIAELALDLASRYDMIEESQTEQ